VCEYAFDGGTFGAYKNETVSKRTALKRDKHRKADSDSDVMMHNDTDAQQCATVALLPPALYPMARAYTYEDRDDVSNERDASTAPTLVALHMTTYFGSDKSFGARELG
jgi:hypothetical protein